MPNMPDEIYVTPNGIWEHYGKSFFKSVDYFFTWDGECEKGERMECYHNVPRVEESDIC